MAKRLSCSPGAMVGRKNLVQEIKPKPTPSVDIGSELTVLRWKPYT